MTGPLLLRGENDSKQSSEIQARFLGVFFYSLCVQEIPAREVSQTTKRARSMEKIACVQTSPISFVARGKGNRRRLHAGNGEDDDGGGAQERHKTCITCDLRSASIFVSLCKYIPAGKAKRRES